MLIRALKTTTGRPKGTVHEVDDSTGKELVTMGYAIEVLPLAKQEAAPVAANDNRPLAAGNDRTGSPTGADAPQSSLPAGQAQPQPELTQQKDERVSCASTTPTGSPHGQTPSMPATTTGGKRKRGRQSSKG